MDREKVFQEFETLFWELTKKVQQLWKEIYASTFPGSQSRIMYLLEQKGPLKMSELASILHITAGAVTTASNILIRNGYITRSRSETDRRVVRLTLTEKGQSTLFRLKREGQEKMAFVFRDISHEDLENMQAIFKQATKSIDQL